ncbi:DUF397 domain-containing protein [Streptomyces sp. NPDC047315]|uniref:DUF397 domain-containing protein n=1 Tax=Streptomyces sp. NPDC047315 TaxID=3155142 RepID=UPI0033E20058
MTTTTEPLSWLKSSYSDPNGGNCIEWAPADAYATGVVPVRDSKAPAGPVLRIPAPAFVAFVTGIKGGTV